jgi:hypothetical protein
VGRGVAWSVIRRATRGIHEAATLWGIGGIGKALAKYFMGNKW